MAQGPLLTVHWNTLAPIPRPVTVVVGLLAVVMVPEPLTKVHWPVAGNVGVLPAKVASLGVHTSWSAPAFAFGLALEYTVTVTSSDVEPGVQGPLLMVQRKTCTPTVRPVTLVFRTFGFTMVPPPLTWLHTPVAGADAALPFNVTELVGEQMVMSEPAFAAGWALSKMVITTSSWVGVPQGPLLMVHRKRLTPIPSPVTVVLDELGLVIVPVPFTKVQVPTAGETAVLPASVAVFVGRQNS